MQRLSPWLFEPFQWTILPSQGWLRALSGSTSGTGRCSGDISATRLSQRDPVGFPPHSREWLSILDYHPVHDMVKLETTYLLVGFDPASMDSAEPAPGYRKPGSRNPSRPAFCGNLRRSAHVSTRSGCAKPHHLMGALPLFEILKNFPSRSWGIDNIQ